MKIRLSFLFVLTLIVFILYVFFLSLFEEKSYVPEKTNNKIENFSIKDFYTDKSLNLKILFEDEKYIIINIWSSWCIPCRQEHKHISNLSSFNSSKLIGLNYKDKKNNAIKFLNELGNPYDTILSDKDGTKAIFLGAYGVPETFVIDSDLNIIKKYIGPINSEIVNEIRNLLNDY